MPVYPYVCPTCDTSKEVSQSIHDPISYPSCDSCGYRMVRVWEPPVISFKGSGFYSTGN